MKRNTIMRGRIFVEGFGVDARKQVLEKYT